MYSGMERYVIIKCMDITYPANLYSIIGLNGLYLEIYDDHIVS